MAGGLDGMGLRVKCMGGVLDGMYILNCKNVYHFLFSHTIIMPFPIPDQKAGNCALPALKVQVVQVKHEMAIGLAHLQTESRMACINTMQLHGLDNTSRPSWLFFHQSVGYEKILIP